MAEEESDLLQLRYWTIELEKGKPVKKRKLSSAFRQAALQGLINFNPVRDAAVPQGKRPNTQAHSVLDVAQMVKAWKNVRMPRLL